MKRLITSLCLTISLVMGSFGMGWSANFQKGFEAFQRGNYAIAIKEFMPLAEGGDAHAQVMVGTMYEHGLSVPQDSKTAVKWYTLSAEQGLK